MFVWVSSLLMYYPVGIDIYSGFGKFYLISYFCFSALQIPNTFEKNLINKFEFYSSFIWFSTIAICFCYGIIYISGRLSYYEFFCYIGSNFILPFVS